MRFLTFFKKKCFFNWENKKAEKLREQKKRNTIKKLLFFSFYFLFYEYMKFETALVEFAKKLSRRGFAIISVKKYIDAVKKIYSACNKDNEEWHSITARAIENFIYGNKKRSSGTKRVHAVQIRAFLKFCSIEWEPVINYQQVVLTKYHQKEARYLTEEEEKKVLEELQYKNLTLRASIHLMLSTGLRVDEACNLTKKQLKSAQLVEWVYQIPIQGKGQETNPIFLPEMSYKLCNKLAEKHKKRTVLGIRTDSLQHAIKRFSSEIEIAFSAHTFRHTYITRLAEKWVELYKVQKLARHKCIITTSRYLHTHNVELARVVGRLAENSY